MTAVTYATVPPAVAREGPGPVEGVTAITGKVGGE